MQAYKALWSLNAKNPEDPQAEIIRQLMDIAWSKLDETEVRLAEDWIAERE